MKDKLAKSEGDRQALISRLRDAQIQMELYRNQIFELQTAVIEKLSLFSNQKVIKTKSEDQIQLNKHVENWLPTDRDKYNG